MGNLIRVPLKNEDYKNLLNKNQKSRFHSGVDSLSYIVKHYNLSINNYLREKYKGYFKGMSYLALLFYLDYTLVITPNLHYSLINMNALN